MICYKWLRKRIPQFFFMFIVIYLCTLFYIYKSKLEYIRANRKDVSFLNHRSLKYVLQWTRRSISPFDWMGEGNSAFVKYNCEHTNCFVTDDKDYFHDVRVFDAIVFNGRDVIYLWPSQMPSQRSMKQKYIFGSMESPDNFPACDENLDHYFNWTWTYKLDSDLLWRYITIYDLNGQTVGPRNDMTWPKMEPIDDALKRKLLRKTKLVAWFVSHCLTNSGREYYVEKLNRELQNSGWSVDVYGNCSNRNCPKSNQRSCFKMIEDDYHFYLSFENSFSEDYVTEKLLTALNNYAIPIVFGAANYTRFLPNGSYLDANALDQASLAREMINIMANKTRFFDFFRWRNHFIYKDTEGLEVCNLCEMLNNEERVQEISVWRDFRKWWNGAKYKQNCMS